MSIKRDKLALSFYMSLANPLWLETIARASRFWDMRFLTYEFEVVIGPSLPLLYGLLLFALAYFFELKDGVGSGTAI